jgi:hypothetical protein
MCRGFASRYKTADAHARRHEEGRKNQKQHDGLNHAAILPVPGGYVDSTLSEAHRRRVTIPPAAGRPWSEKELAMHGKVPDELLARQTRRTVSAVVAMRHKMRIEKWSVWD